MAKTNVMVKATALSNAAGRIDYISNPKRQENLVATYSSTSDPTYWHELANHCQQMNAKYGSGKKTEEAREVMGVLDNRFAKMDPQVLAKKISDDLKAITGTENVVAIHWNKTKSSYHYHGVFSECKEINQVKDSAVLTRDTYYDAAGKRSTKKKCVDEATGELLPGCTMLKKGSRKTEGENVRFSAKDSDFSSKTWLMDYKNVVKDMHNEYLKEDKYQVYNAKRDNNDLYLTHQTIGNKIQDESLKEKIREKNKLVKDWNNTVDQLLQHDPYFKRGAAPIIRERRNDVKKFKNDVVEWIRRVKFYLQDFKRTLQKLTDMKKEKAFKQETKDTLQQPQKKKVKYDPEPVLEAFREFYRQTAALYDTRPPIDKKLQKAPEVMQQAMIDLQLANRTIIDLSYRIEKNRLPFGKQKQERENAYKQLPEAQKKAKECFETLKEYGVSEYYQGVKLKPTWLGSDEIEYLNRQVERKSDEFKRKFEHESRFYRPANALEGSSEVQNASQRRFESLCRDFPIEHVEKLRKELEEAVNDQGAYEYTNMQTLNHVRSVLQRELPEPKNENIREKKKMLSQEHEM